MFINILNNIISKTFARKSLQFKIKLKFQLVIKTIYVISLKQSYNKDLEELDKKFNTCYNEIKNI